jgi:transposase
LEYRWACREDGRLCCCDFRVTRPTAHRRFAEWTRAGLWERLHQAVLDRLGAAGQLDWSRAVVDSISVRAEKKGN